MTTEPVPSQRPAEVLRPWHRLSCPASYRSDTANPTADSGVCDCGLDDALASLATTPEGLTSAADTSTGGVRCRRCGEWLTRSAATPEGLSENDEEWFAPIRHAWTAPGSTDENHPITRMVRLIDRLTGGPK